MPRPFVISSAFIVINIIVKQLGSKNGYICYTSAKQLGSKKIHVIKRAEY